MEKRILVILLMFMVFLPMKNLKAKQRAKGQYQSLQTMSGTDLNLQLNSNDFAQDLNERFIEFHFLVDARSLITNATYPSSIKMEIHDASSSERRLLSIFRPTIMNLRRAKKLFVDVELPNLRKTSTIEVDVYDSNDDLHSTYMFDLTVSNSASVSYADLVDSTCNGTFGACHMDYIVQNLRLQSLPANGVETKVEKNIDGSYTVNVPFARSRKKVKVKNKITGIGGTGTPVLSDIDFEFDGSNLFVNQENGSQVMIGGGVGSIGPTGPAGPQGPSGSPEMDTVLLQPATANLPAANPAIPDLGSTTHRILYDDSTDESVNWTNIKIANYAGGNLAARIGYSMDTAIAGDIVFNVELWCVSDGDAVDLDTESYDAVNVSAVTTVPGTAGHLDEITINLMNDDSIAEGDLCAFRLTRDADNASDTAVGDAEVRYLEITE